MQVQHEIQLLREVSPIISDSVDLTLDAYTLARSATRSSTELAYSPVEDLVAVHINDPNQIVLIDTKAHSKRDRFPLKPCDKKYSRQSFNVKGLNFSPDGTRLAVGQTDCIIYIYRLSNQQSNQTNPGNTISGASRPTITGKFVCSSPITCLIWKEFGIIFGTQDGKVKLVSTTKSTPNPNESQTLSSTSTRVIGLYNSPKDMMSVSLAYKAPYLVIGFVDGSVLLSLLTIDHVSSIELGQSEYLISDTRRASSQPQIQFTIIEHSCPPVCLAIMQSGTVLCCAGTDGKLIFYNIYSERTPATTKSTIKLDSLRSHYPLAAVWMQSIELESSVEYIDYSPANDILAVATSKRLIFIKYDQESATLQQQTSFIEFVNQFLSITSLIWSNDGSQLIVSTSIGSLELFKCTWNKQSITGQLDICHIAKNRVRITDGARNLLATYKTQYDIKRVNLLQEQYVIIWTSNSLLLGQLSQAGAQTEIDWTANREKGSTRFSFKHQDFVLIYNNFTRELKIVRLGENAILHSVKFDQPIKPYGISVRRYPVKFEPAKMISPERNSRFNTAASNNERASSPEIKLDSLNQPLSEVKASDHYESLVERLAYVSDLNQLYVINLKKNPAEQEFVYKHQESIDWIKMSYTGNHLIFRDKQLHLHLVNLSPPKVANTENVTTMLLASKCEFAGWLKRSDILVAQSRHNIFIWYNVSELHDKVCVDSRSLNFLNAPPIIDLSFATESRHRSYPIVKGINEFALNLTNGNSMELDEVKVKFYTQLCAGNVSNQLEAAKTVLENYQAKKADGKSLRNLWTKLGWLAIERSECRLALHAFGRLEYKSMVNFLEKCLTCSDEDQEWKLAMLNGSWERFERIRETEQVIATYKRLNKWSRLIDFLTRAQLSRQRDLAEQERLIWLTKMDRHIEAARIKAESGDVCDAIEMMMANKLFEEGADLLIEKQTTPLRSKTKSGAEQRLNLKLEQLAKDLKDKLIGKCQYERAAMLCEQVLSDPGEALELYLRGDKFESCLKLAKQVATNRVGEIEGLYGEYLVKEYAENRSTRKKASEAIDHFAAANMADRALEVAISLGEFQRAFQQLKQIAAGGTTKEEDLKLSESFSLLAKHFIHESDTDAAVEALLIGKHYTQVVDLQLELGNFEQAFKISCEYIHKNDNDKVEKAFCGFAEKLAAAGQLDEAEKMFLMLDKPDAAIEMLRNAKNHDRMLEIVERFHPDLLESNLLLQAREAELEGRLEDAERYMLKASQSEWTNVVRMYRLANKWSEAYRVALEHCSSRQDPLLVQLAYWWCKSLLNEGLVSEACRLIGQLEVTDQVVDFACENRNFQLAIDVSSGEAIPNSKRATLIKRYAAYLEQQHKFDKAEELLVGASLFREAAHMYLDNGMYTEALRVIEQRLGASSDAASDPADVAADESELGKLLNETLVECANRISAEAEPKQLRINGSLARGNEEKLIKAQQLYLRAGRPELAVEMYKAREMWQEAIKLAQRFAPQLLESIELALDSRASEDLAPIVAIRGDSRNKSVSGRSMVPLSNGSGASSTRGALEKYLEKLALDKPDEEDSVRDSGTSAIENCLKHLRLATEGLSSLIQDAGSGRLEQCLAAARQVVASSDLIARQCKWGLWPIGLAEQDGRLGEAGDVLAVWREARDLLALAVLEMGQVNYKEQILANAKSALADLQRRLSAFHYVVLHAYLANQLQIDNAAYARHLGGSRSGAATLSALSEPTPGKMARWAAISLAQDASYTHGDTILTLLGRLSLSLLRYTDFMNPVNTFYASGLWLVAARQLEPARFVWARLIELTESGSPASSESDRERLKRTYNVPLDELAAVNNRELQQVGEVRRWLLEGLIGEKDSQQRVGLRRSIFPPNGAALKQVEPLPGGGGPNGLECLICGYAVLASDPDQLVSSQPEASLKLKRNPYKMHLGEWRNLLLMSASANRKRLPTQTGAEKSSLREMLLNSSASYSTGKIELSQITDFIGLLSGCGDVPDESLGSVGVA